MPAPTAAGTWTIYCSAVTTRPAGKPHTRCGAGRAALRNRDLVSILVEPDTGSIAWTRWPVPAAIEPLAGEKRQFVLTHYWRARRVWQPPAQIEDASPGVDGEPPTPAVNEPMASD